MNGYYDYSYELDTVYDRRKSFYGKAVVLEKEDASRSAPRKVLVLRSYSTIVASIVTGTNPKAMVYGWYSNTTGRHIKEFLKQHGFRAENKAQILKDYYVEDGEMTG